MRAEERAEVREQAAHFMQLVGALRVLSDMQIVRIREASVDDLVDAKAAARHINKGLV